MPGPIASPPPRSEGAGILSVAAARAPAEVATAAEVEAKAIAVPAQGKRRRSAPSEGATPATKRRKPSQHSGTKKVAPKEKKAPEEPVEPAPPPDAFTLFSKSKWSVLVGGPVARLEQAKLMWKALEPNDRSAFQAQATALQAKHKEACEAYSRDFEAYRQALPPAARAELKRKEREAAQAEKNRAKEQKEREKEFRVRLREMGDRLKDNLQICRFGPKRGGIWAVPDGQIRFRNVGYDFFLFIFRGLTSPAGATQSAPLISLQLSQDQAGSVFGVTKLRGGSMYAKFRVRSMSVTYRPNDQSLELGYKMEEYYF